MIKENTVQSIEDELSALLGKAFVEQNLPVTLGKVHRCKNYDLADYQCNGAMIAAKKYQAGNPYSLAQKIIKTINNYPGIDNIVTVKPGFINICIGTEKLSDVLQKKYKVTNWGITDNSLGNTKVIIDSGGPNVAKAMHVGHLRTANIGEALRRIFLAKGYDVITDVHLGDWGTQMGMLIEGIRKRQPNLVYFDKNYNGDYPHNSPVTIEDLEEIYPQESNICKKDPKKAEKARKATAELQNRRPGYFALWRHFVDVSIATLKADYAALNVHFDLWNGESDADKYIKPTIDFIKEKGIAKLDEGALIVPILDKQKKPLMPPLILRKSDGAVMYSTTDIATLYERVFLTKANIILYVVDGRQQQHFCQIFAVADMMGMNANTIYEHNYFGTVNGKDGKPFKTRAGGVMKLNDLITMAIKEAKKKLSQTKLGKEFPQKEQDEIARKIAISALKFSDLRNHRIKNYIFDLEKFSEFEGKTGPYLLMQITRMKSILRKAKLSELNIGKYYLGKTNIEKNLVLKLLDFDQVINVTIDKRAPHFLCEHVYQLAQLFSSFYQMNHILSEPDKNKQTSMLTLVKICLSQLEYGINLLGIDTLDRM